MVFETIYYRYWHKWKINFWTVAYWQSKNFCFVRKERVWKQLISFLFRSILRNVSWNKVRFFVSCEKTYSVRFLGRTRTFFFSFLCFFSSQIQFNLSANALISVPRGDVARVLNFTTVLMRRNNCPSIKR